MKTGMSILCVMLALCEAHAGEVRQLLKTERRSLRIFDAAADVSDVITNTAGIALTAEGALRMRFDVTAWPSAS